MEYSSCWFTTQYLTHLELHTAKVRKKDRLEMQWSVVLNYKKPRRQLNVTEYLQFKAAHHCESNSNTVKLSLV